MSIVVSCLSCGTVMRVPESAAGRRGKCRGCGSVVQVPVNRPLPEPLSLDDISSLESIGSSGSAVPQQLLTCSRCDGSFTYVHIRNIGGRMVCTDCVSVETRNRKKTLWEGPPIPEHLQQIALWERRTLWVILMFPLAFLVLPQLFVTYKLARALGLNALCWTIGMLIPYVNILVLFALNAQAVSMLKGAGLRVRPFALRWHRAP